MSNSALHAAGGSGQVEGCERPVVEGDSPKCDETARTDDSALPLTVSDHRFTDLRQIPRLREASLWCNWHRVYGGHTRLPGSALDADDFVAMFPRTFGLAKLVVDPCQQKMGLIILRV